MDRRIFRISKLSKVSKISFVVAIFLEKKPLKSQLLLQDLSTISLYVRVARSRNS